MAAEQELLALAKGEPIVTVQSLSETTSFTTSSRTSHWTAWCRNLGASILTEFPGSYSTHRKEPAKVIVDRSFTIALLRCCIHLLPVGCTAALGYLNLTGYFIGDQLDGGASARARDMLLLQIGAKIMEILVVASLTTIVFDVIRHQALSKAGLPLGLLGSGFHFSQLSFFWSPQYVVGSRGIRSRRRRWLIMAVLAVCGLTATVSGPSSALLMIPALRTRWPAGSTDFWLVGTDDTLWPDHLGASQIGGDMCLNPSDSMTEIAPLNMSSCIWHGYSQLAQGLKDRHFDWQSNITVNDGVVKRQLLRQQFIASGTETWVLGVHVSAASISRLIADEWYWATLNATSAQKGARHEHLKNATDGANVAKVPSWLPTTRTACLNHIEFAPNVTYTFDFVKLPEYDAFTPGDYFTLDVDVPGVPNITTQWLTPPDPEEANHLGAVFVAIIPTGFDGKGNVNETAVFTCSVDTRWAFGTNVGTGLPNTDHMVVHGELQETRKPGVNLSSSVNAFLPTKGPFWHFASVDSDWLGALTPSLSTEVSGWTTLAKEFTYAGFDNSTGLISSNWASLGATIESTLATTLVDGMSRLGLADNNGNMAHVMPDRYRWLRWLDEKTTNNGRYFDRLLDGETIVVPPFNISNNDLVRLRWSVTVSGLAYSADSTPYYLALGVLLFHAVLALSHIVTSLVTRRTSQAWDTFEEMLLLAQNSRQVRDGRLENTCAGVYHGGVLSGNVRIGVLEDGGLDEGEERVQLVFGGEGLYDGGEDVGVVKENVVYGSNGEARRRVVRKRERVGKWLGDENQNRGGDGFEEVRVRPPSHAWVE